MLSKSDTIYSNGWKGILICSGQHTVDTVFDVFHGDYTCT